MPRLPRFATVRSFMCLSAVMFVAMVADAADRPAKVVRPLSIPEMATAYRVQAYLKHHHDRETYQRHRKAAQEMIARWKAAGSPEGAEVATWFQDARQASLGGQLPPEVLELAPSPSEQLVESKPEPTTSRPAFVPASMTKPGDDADADPSFETVAPEQDPIVPAETYNEPETSTTPPSSTTEPSSTEESTDELDFQNMRSEFGVLRSAFKALVRAFLAEHKEQPH